MSLRINSNVSALNTHRNMTATSNLQVKNLEKKRNDPDLMDAIREQAKRLKDRIHAAERI